MKTTRQNIQVQLESIDAKSPEGRSLQSILRAIGDLTKTHTD